MAARDEREARLGNRTPSEYTDAGYHEMLDQRRADRLSAAREGVVKALDKVER